MFFSKKNVKFYYFNKNGKKIVVKMKILLIVFVKFFFSYIIDDYDINSLNEFVIF
jgi:hypothetical protein